MEITGQVTAILPERSGVGQKGEWKSQDFVLSMINGRFVSNAVCSVWGADKLATFNIQQGETITVCFDFDAQQSQKTGGWFNSLRVYDIKRNGQSVSLAATTNQMQQQMAQQQQAQQMPQNQYQQQPQAQGQYQQQQMPFPPPTDNDPFTTW